MPFSAPVIAATGFFGSTAAGALQMSLLFGAIGLFSHIGGNIIEVTEKVMFGGETKTPPKQNDTFEKFLTTFGPYLKKLGENIDKGMDKVEEGVGKVSKDIKEKVQKMKGNREKKVATEKV